MAAKRNAGKLYLNNDGRKAFFAQRVDIGGIASCTAATCSNAIAANIRPP
jgi:hypothetical protein